MIVFNNVSKRYAGGVEALKQVSFELEQGEMAFLTGHSGAGKSSVLKLISLIERSNYGQIIVGGCNYQKMAKRMIPYIRRQMGIIFQSPMLLDDRTIFENVALPLVIGGYSKADIQRRTRAALDKVGLLKKEKMYPVMLSGGEQQRVGIARAVVHRPKLLLADEPTGNLDPKLSAEIMHLFEAFQKVGVSVLIASHDLSLIASMQHRILTLRDGKIVSDI